MNQPILDAPSIEYGQLSPMLIVFAVGVLGVIAEAFAPRAMRYRIQMTLALGGTAAALASVVVLASILAESDSVGTRAVMGAVAVDRPTLFLQGTLLLVALPSLLLVGERTFGRIHADSRVQILLPRKPRRCPEASRKGRPQNLARRRPRCSR